MRMITLYSVLVMTGKKMILKMQTDLDTIHEWCASNRLQLNVKKSKTILLATS